VELHHLDGRDPRFSRMALRDYLATDWTMFFVHSGTGLEQLAKAYLASFHPSLIADGKSFDSLLHACGRGGHARTPREAMRTIGAAEAISRCGQILPRLRTCVLSWRLSSSHGMAQCTWVKRLRSSSSARFLPFSEHHGNF
jgi:hypothetical protein